ncbi:uncharacterized protein [Nicotiana tomentosiformis]|uniref:uncharacterized protein n=1 Tax=Nicotiana tomentosiformis TaxID=4098 RepID=UPI00388C9433
MVDGTRSKVVDDRLNQHDEVLEEMLSNQQAFRTMQTGIQGILELILERLTTLERVPNRDVGDQPQGDGLLPISAQDMRLNKIQLVPIPPPKWELPSFEGYEPKVWIRKCERYFNLYRTPDNQKVEADALYLNGLAEKWYNSLVLSRGIIGWVEFKEELCSRFGGELLEDTLKEFNKLTQTGVARNMYQATSVRRSNLIAWWEKLRLENVKNRNLTVLIDSGSTHSFIDENIVKETSYQSSYCPPMKKHNLTKFDHEKKCFTIGRKGNKLALHGILEEGRLSMISSGSLGRIIKKCHVIISHLFMLSTSSVSNQKPVADVVTRVFDQYTDIFAEPKSLPHVRSLNHAIPLKPRSMLVSLRPYRYNYYQKDELEKQVKEMLTNGTIQQSQSHFSSLAFLICGIYESGSKDRYHQIRIRVEDMHKTAFRTHLDHYEFKWNIEADLAFSALKTAMSSTPILALPDYSKEFIVETNVSHNGIGVVLMQEGRPIVYFSKVLTQKHKGKSIYKKECMALMNVVDKWRHYLQFKHFVGRTNHHSLKYLLEQKVTLTIQQKGLTKLLGLDYEVQYKMGTENRVVDTLSRQHEKPYDYTDHGTGQLLTISVLVPMWMQEIGASFVDDDQAQGHIVQFTVDLNGPNIWHYSSRVLRRKGKIYVGATGKLRQQLVSIFHDSSIGGHSRQLGTFKRLALLFYWPGMKRMVVQHVTSCDVCLRNKEENVAYPGLLQPQPIPNQVWSHVSMDFIEGIPKSHNQDAILVGSGHDIKLSIGPLLETIVPTAEDAVMKRQQMLQLLKDNLCKSQERMKLYADKRRTNREFQIGNVAYKLELPSESMVHPVFHVSLLKKKKGNKVVAQTTLPLTSEDGQFQIKPIAILERKMVKKNNVVIVKVLVQWSNLPPEDATWEDYQFLKATFPDFHS